VPNEPDLHAFIDRIVAAARLGTEQERDELRRELRAHFEDAGSSPEAVRAAMARFGAGPEIGSLLRRVHDPAAVQQSRSRWFRVEEIVQDIRFGVRMLVRSPAFALTAIVSLAVGIGATAAVLSWMEGIELRPFPLVQGEDRLVALTGTMRGDLGRDDVSWPDFLDLQRRSTLFDAHANRERFAAYHRRRRARRFPRHVRRLLIPVLGAGVDGAAAHRRRKE